MKRIPPKQRAEAATKLELLVAICVVLVASSLVVFALSPVPSGKPAGYPAWWFERDVIRRSDTNVGTPSWPTNYLPSDDYATLNAGQLKALASRAYDELHVRLATNTWTGSTNAPGPVLASLIQTWSTNTSAGDNYAVVNQGQLKNVAKKFYDVLAGAGYVAGTNVTPSGWTNGTYPWSSSTNSPDAYAAANIGQAKYLFSFDLAAWDGNTSGLPDWWEELYFDGIPQDPAADPDGDGLTNFQEYEANSNPLDYYNGELPTLQIVSGNNQSGPAGVPVSDPLVVKVMNSGSVALTNAPVTFSIIGSHGVIAVTGTGSFASSQELITGTAGTAQVYLKPSGTLGALNQVQALATSGTSTVSVLFSATVAPAPNLATIRFSEGYELASVNEGQSAEFAVTVVDPAESVEKVELYVSGTKVAESTVAPYTTSWTPSASGRFVVVARLLDSSGQADIDAKMLLVTGSSVASPVYSPAGGGMAVTFSATNDTIAALPFLPPAEFAGRVTGFDGNEISVEGASWAPGHFISGTTTYVLEVLEGPRAGTGYTITGNTSSSLLVEGSLAGADLAGRRFQIRPSWTAHEAVPEVLFAPGGGDAPELKIPDETGAGIDRPYAKTLTWASGGWLDGASPSGDFALPSSWFMVRNKLGLNVVWTVVGDVLHSSVHLLVSSGTSGPQDTPLALPRPGSFSPLASGLMSGEILQESPSLGTPGDLLLGFSSPSGPIGRTPDVMFYRYRGGFYRFGAEGTDGDLSGTEIFHGGSGWILRHSGTSGQLFNHAEQAIP